MLEDIRIWPRRDPLLPDLGSAPRPRGWICPRCRRSNAPSVATCRCWDGRPLNRADWSGYSREKEG